MTEALQVALRVAAALESCGLRYVIGGSVASSWAGEPRSTLDVDFAIELPEAKIPALARALGGEFYFDVEQARHAVRAGSSASAIHEASGVKVDFFISATAFDRRQMERRKLLPIGEGKVLYVCTPEDILVQKLRRYRMGQEVSDRQWRDVLGIVLVQGKALDLEYARQAAAEIGVADLLGRALGQAGP